MARVMKFHLICQEESANVKKLSGNKEKKKKVLRDVKESLK